MATIKEWEDSVKEMTGKQVEETLQAIRTLRKWEPFTTAYSEMRVLETIMVSVFEDVHKPKAKTTKTRRIEGVATIVRTGTVCQGCMDWETPYIVIAIGEERYIYQSEKIESMGIEKGDIVRVDMRVGANTNRVWRMHTLKKKREYNKGV